MSVSHNAVLFPSSRFAKEYGESPDRGYGTGVVHVLKKLSSSHLSDVYQPARDQFNGRGSFGNGGAMRAAPFALAFPKLADVGRVSICACGVNLLGFFFDSLRLQYFKCNVFV